MEEAVFVPDDQPGFRVVSVIESRSPRASLGTLEDEIRRVGLAGSERRSERGGEANKTGNGCLTLRRWSEASPIAIDKYELAAVGRQRPIPAMGRRWCARQTRSLLEQRQIHRVRKPVASPGPAPRLFARQGE